MIIFPRRRLLAWLSSLPLCCSLAVDAESEVDRWKRFADLRLRFINELKSMYDEDQSQELRILIGELGKYGRWRLATDLKADLWRGDYHLLGLSRNQLVDWTPGFKNRLNDYALRTFGRKIIDD